MKRRRASALALVIALVVGALGAVKIAQDRRGAAPSASVSVGGESTAEPAAPPVTAHLPWKSGAWTGGQWGTGRVNQFATWRGTRVDTVTTYPAYDTWSQMADSSWHVSVFNGFGGDLVYGLPLLPKAGGSLTDVASGGHDDVWRAVAGDLTENGRSDAYVRVGLEANGTWFPWGSDAAGAERYRAAYRHVVAVMRETAPKLRFVFDITCGAPLKGSNERLGSLTQLYPGDDVVDVVGCDTYDSYTTRVRTPTDFARVARPDNAAGLLDVVDFARQHGKTFAVPEWGLTRVKSHGAGDNPVFMQAMHSFFADHAATLEFENYFNEAADYLQSSLFSPVQNPRAADTYLQLWGPSGGAANPRAASTDEPALPGPDQVVRAASNAAASRARFLPGFNRSSIRSRPLRAS